MKKVYLLVLLALLLGGCRVNLAIEGQGMVTSASGRFDCTNNTNDCTELYTTASSETFTAEPAPGWTFVKWTGCSYKSLLSCSLPILQQGIGSGTPWPVTATFEEISKKVKEATYTYNALGQRKTKMVGGDTTIFVYDLAGNLIAELDETGQTLRQHIHINNEPIAQLTTSPANQVIAVQYVHTDHLGTPILLTNKYGNVVADLEVTPFGETYVDYAEVIYNRRFPGQYKDAETGLRYNYFRDYDPGLGRYLQSDPVGLGSGLNSYAYVAGNPLMYTDFYGLAYSSLGEHGIPYRDSVAKVVPKSAQINLGNLITNPDGTIWSGFASQDWKCTVPIIGCAMDKDPATLPRCINHDQCYEDNACNSSSWLGNALGANKSCNQCNSSF